MKPVIGAVVVVILLLAPFADSDERKPLTFRLTLMGEVEDTGATEAGFRTSYFRTTHLGFKTYEVSDGEKLDIYDGTFTTTDEAVRYFEWNVRNRAARAVVGSMSLVIGAQGVKADRGRKTVGRRAEYLLKSDDKTKTWVVMWTDGATFIAIYAPTLECALEAESPRSPSTTVR